MQNRTAKEEEQKLLTSQLEEVEFPNTAIREILDNTGDLDDVIIYPFSMAVGDTPVEIIATLELSPPNFVYHLTHFQLRRARYSKAFVEANTFSCHPYYKVTVREALNLMAGRVVYRRAEFDPLRQGYWIKLSEVGVYSGYKCLQFIFNGFLVEAGLRQAGLWDLMGIDERADFVKAMERGDLVEIALPEGNDKQTYKFEVAANADELEVYNHWGFSTPWPTTLFSQQPDDDHAEA